MKRFLRILGAAALFTAVFSFAFVSCSNDDNEIMMHPGGGNDDGNGGDKTPAVTKPEITAPATPGTITMNGTPYATIAEALAACTGSDEYTILIAPGTYNEVLSYSGAGKVLLKGTGSAKYGADVLITERNSGNLNKNGGQRSIFFYKGTGSLAFENLIIQNTVKRTDADNTGINTQAECLQAKGLGNVAAYNCSFLSHQDTIQTVAKAWFYDCYVEGDVDFIWMEAGSKVALYENCALVAIGDETDKAYIAAPKCDASSMNVWKGLVVYNSMVKADNPATTLCRNPWGNGGESTSMYNQVAYINTRLDRSGTGAIAGFTLSGKDAFYKAGTPQTIIGWKIDATSKENFGVSTNNVLSAEDVSKEFAGRNNILNRYYDTASSKYVQDKEVSWNVAELATKYGWKNVTNDDSKDFLEGETEIEVETYSFEVENEGAWASDSGVTVDGFSYHANSSTATGGSGKTIKLNLAKNATVIVSGCYSGNGTIKAGNQGEGVYDFNNKSISKFIDKSYTNYSGACELVITAASTTYIQKIVVKYDESIKKVVPTSITVTSPSDKYTVGIPVNLSANVEPFNASNKDVKWSSGDTQKATIDETTGEVKFIAAGEVTFTATSRDAENVTGTITCTAAEATWKKAEWYFTKDSSSSAAAAGIGCSATDVAGENSASWTVKSYSGIAMGKKVTTTLLDGTEAEISTGLKMDSNGELTISVPKSAKLTVLQGFFTDRSGYLVIASTDGTATPQSDNPTAAISEDSVYIWTLTPGTYTVKRNTGNTGAIYYAKCEITE